MALASVQAGAGQDDAALDTLARAVAAGAHPSTLAADRRLVDLLAGPGAAVLASVTLDALGPRPELTANRKVWPTDGWSVRPPSELGLDEAVLDAAAAYVEGDYPLVHGLLVVRGGHIVFERAFNGHASHHEFNVKSVTKSYLGCLTGLAVAQGHVSLDQTQGELLPEVFHDGIDADKRAIRLVDLLTMSAGWEWEENGPVTLQWQRSEDRLAFLRDLPLTGEPGVDFAYSTAVAHLVSAVLTANTGTSTLAFADEHLFGPLGLELDAWSVDPAGIYDGSSEMRWSPREMAKLGYLYLNDGVWDGVRLLPEGWVEASTTAHRRYSPFRGYGYLWSLRNLGGHATYVAAGYGGQRIFVVPDLDLVVVIVADTANPKHWVEPIITGWVIPAVKG